MHTTLRVIVRFVLVTSLALIFTACLQIGQADWPKEVALPDRPAVSPSGKDILTVWVHQDGPVEAESFRILDQNQKLLFTSTDSYRTRDTLVFLWDDSDRVWVYSGDVGTFYWQQTGSSGQWEKFSYSHGGAQAPRFLKEFRPDDHPR